MTIRDRSRVIVPPCPQCGAPVEVDWIDVRRMFDQRPEWLPGQVHCTANPDHDMAALRAGHWAFERRTEFFIDGAGPLDGSLSVRCDPIPMVSSGAKSDPSWTFTDACGHWHAYSSDKDEPYPTLSRKVEHRECDGSCGGACEGEGFHTVSYSCLICNEQIEPGAIPGPYTFLVPGLQSWEVVVDGFAAPFGKVSVRVECNSGETLFGVAQVVDVIVDDGFARSSLIGVGPLGKRSAARAEAAA